MDKGIKNGLKLSLIVAHFFYCSIAYSQDKQQLNNNLFKTENLKDPYKVELLLKQGADPNTVDIFGNPILLDACSTNFATNDKVAKILIKYGADVNKTNKAYATALLNTIYFNRWGLTEYLIKNGLNKENLNNGLLQTTRLTPEMLKLLIHYGVNVNVTNSSGQTPLMQIYSKNHKIAKILVQNGANINATDKKGNSVLMYISTYKDPGLIKLLGLNRNECKR